MGMAAPGKPCFDNNEEMMAYCLGTGRTYCSIYIAQSGRPLGSFIIELFTDVCPKTCAHFLALLPKYKVRRGVGCQGVGGWRAEELGGPCR